MSNDRINSSRLDDAYMRQKTMLSLIEIMACRCKVIFQTNAGFSPIGHMGSFIGIWIKYNSSHTRKSILNIVYKMVTVWSLPQWLNGRLQRKVVCFSSQRASRLFRKNSHVTSSSYKKHVLPMTFSNWILRKKIILFWLKFLGNLFPMVQLTIFNNRFRW